MLLQECPPVFPVMWSGSQRGWWPTFIPGPGPLAQLSWSVALLAAWEAASSTWRSRSIYLGCSGQEPLQSCCVTGWQFRGVHWSADPTEIDLPRWVFVWSVDRLIHYNQCIESDILGFKQLVSEVLPRLNCICFVVKHLCHDIVKTVTKCTFLFFSTDPCPPSTWTGSRVAPSPGRRREAQCPRPRVLHFQERSPMEWLQPDWNPGKDSSQAPVTWRPA